jgi:hypothetical protein
LVNKPYGAAFLKSLPPIPRCRDLAHLADFWTPPVAMPDALLQEETKTDENSGD